VSINDLDLILNQQPHIATYLAQHLAKQPDKVEHVYAMHARTHIPLGETCRYVETMFKWVGGANKGAFVGAVVGEYGHGKTSYQVHIWDQSGEKDVLAVPPFSWEKTSDIVDGVAAWIQHVLRKTYPDLARKAERMHKEFAAQSIEMLAEKVARESSVPVDHVIQTLTATMKTRPDVDVLELPPDRVLDYIDSVSEVVKRAHFAGLLVLLDEPEQTALKRGYNKVAGILFEFANELLHRDGDYGLFVCIPEKFLASAQRSFPSLVSRLQGRNCLVRLRDLHGSTFARDLWGQYMQALSPGVPSDDIVLPETLTAIGQVGSSERDDLSYGPRTVVSAFSQMVRRYKEHGTPYTPAQFAQDCLKGEILVNPDYQGTIRAIINDRSSAEIAEQSILTMSAFPDGITDDILSSLHLNDAVKNALRAGLVYKRGLRYVVKALRKPGKDETKDNELQDSIQEILAEFFPSNQSFRIARDAFINHVFPSVFKARKGQQLQGWDLPKPGDWEDVGDDGRAAFVEGAFLQTYREYPQRRLLVSVEPFDGDCSALDASVVNGESPDLSVRFLLCWNPESARPQCRVTLGGDSAQVPSEIILVIDLTANAVSNKHLEQFIDQELLTPYALLYLFSEMDLRHLPHDVQQEWVVVRNRVLRDLSAQFFAGEDMRGDASEIAQQSIPGGASDLLGTLCLHSLRRRFPDYSTLIRQPKWEDKIRDYTRALQNEQIPLHCRRAREPWVADKGTVADAFGTSVMNLSDAFSSYDNLVTMTMRQNEASVEFHIHPFEQQIVESIMAEKPAGKLKIGGKDCWWIPVADVMDSMLQSAYTEEEIKRIIEIGRSRGSFIPKVHNGQRILYCVPLDPEQLQEKLREKMAALESEIKAMNNLPDYHSSFSAEVTADAIDRVQDDADYEKIASVINREFEANHQRIDRYFERLDNELSQFVTRTRNSNDLLQKDRRTSGLKTPSQGTSRWVSDLNRYIVTNLRETAKDLVKTGRNLAAEATRLKKTHPGGRTVSPAGRIDGLVQGFATLDELEDTSATWQRSISQFQHHVDEYEQWVALLAQSDQLSSRLDDLQEEPGHADFAKRQIKQLETVWQDISDHLATRNVTGLGSHRQFAEQIADIDKKRQEYVSRLRGAFEIRKKQANSFLNSAGLSGDARITATYNPLDSGSSYEQLHDMAATLLDAACESEVVVLNDLELRLVYARDVSGRLQTGDAAPLLEAVERAIVAVSGIRDQVAPQWVKDLLEAQSTEDTAVTVRKTLEQARQAAREARKALRRTNREEPSDEGKRFLHMVTQEGKTDLKEIILHILIEGTDSTEALDLALTSLSELFRKELIQIKVEALR